MFIDVDAGTMLRYTSVQLGFERVLFILTVIQ